MKRIAIYDRYLSTAGGGERYSCKIAEILSEQKDFEVDLITDIFVDLKEVSTRLNLDLTGVNLKIFPFVSEDYAARITREYDLFINATYLSSLPAYGRKNIFLCYFPTPFDIDFTFLHKFLLVFFRRPARWLFRFADRLEEGFDEIKVEEGLYDPKRFLLRRGSWSSGKVILSVKKYSRYLKFGLKNPVTSAVDLMNIKIGVFEGETENREPLYDVTIQLKKGIKKSVEIPIDFIGQPVRILISSDTFVPSEADSSSKDSRKLGVVVYNQGRMNFFKKAVLKILGYIPLFLITYPKDLTFLVTYDRIVTISEYSKRWIKKLWGKESTILFPPVDIDSFRTENKGKIILSVGRFFPEHHNKKQLELVGAFRELFDQYPAEMRDYTLYLAGGVGSRTDHLEYVEKVKAAGKSYPIKVITNINWEELVEIFARSYIFWHASGLGEDERIHPEKFEHFGITTVEAMAAGCIPVVINKGGQKEIIRNGYDGFLFDSLEELKDITLKIISGKINIDEIRKNAAESCRRFSGANFKRDLISIVNETIKDR
ncbi:MAG: glycosyltransferase [Actinomycetota bacterium]|nr:glycosyltransferase [Actinomycetota bacterium]